MNNLNIDMKDLDRINKPMTLRDIHTFRLKMATKRESVTIEQSVVAAV